MKKMFLSKTNNQSVEVQIHDSQFNALGIYARPGLAGFFSPSIRYTGQDRSGNAGHIVTGLKYGGRAMPISGFIQADSLSDFNTAVESLANILALEEDRYGRPTKMNLRVVSDTNRQFTIPVVLRDEPTLPDHNLLFGNFMLPLFAPEPMFRQIPAITSAQLNISQNLGALLPAMAPFRLGTAHGSQLVLYNNGNVDAFPFIHVQGQLTNPVIINNTTNQFFKLNYTFPTGSTGSIDMSQGADALANGVTNINNFRASGSSAWPLVLGANNISLQTSNPSDVGHVTLEYYHLRTNIN